MCAFCPLGNFYEMTFTLCVLLVYNDNGSVKTLCITHVSALCTKCLHRPIDIINQQYTKGEIHFLYLYYFYVFGFCFINRNHWNGCVSLENPTVCPLDCSALRIINHKSRKRHSILIFTMLPTNIVKLSYQPSYNAHDVLFLQYSQSYPQDFPRMTSLSLTRRGGVISYTTCFARKVIMTSQANTPKRQRCTTF